MDKMLCLNSFLVALGLRQGQPQATGDNLAYLFCVLLHFVGLTELDSGGDRRP